MSHNHPQTYTKTELANRRKVGFQQGLTYLNRHPGATLKLQPLSRSHEGCEACLAYEAGWVTSGAAGK